MTASPAPTYDDEIDLRAIFQLLWKARRVIFFVPLGAALVAFAVSFWFIPHKYQAATYVFIGNPVVDFAQATGLTISPTPPDLRAVVQLAVAPGLVESVARDPVVVAAIGDEEIILAKMMAASDVGKDQLRLQVTDTDPQRAALLANAWAEKVTAVVNVTYGVGAIAQTLDSQVLQSQQDYEQAQAALEEALSKSRVDALGAQLQRAQIELKCGLESNSHTTRVLEDLQVFEQGLSGLSTESPLSLGDGLALLTLRQRSLASQPCQLENQAQSSNAPDLTVEIDSTSFAGFTVSKALGTTAQMRAALQTQLTRSQSDQSRLEQEIPQLQGDLENAQAQLAQFTLRRDRSQELYAALLQQQQRIATVLAQSAKVAAMSVEAVPPDEALPRGVLVNTAVAGALGLVLSVFGALGVEWWRNEVEY